jgi:hypothetical protein
MVTDIDSYAVNHKFKNINEFMDFCERIDKLYPDIIGIVTIDMHMHYNYKGNGLCVGEYVLGLS